ncbi:ABC-type transporter, periplasmic subunit [uncultured Pleomorphomonas sp.]|uniref:ABC-type transporter, periplasmic subunit n=1 Tax=uncultured Pleomorphomonas sp. TaxID=442121 RepID=A0A212L8I6_9HYPH|nr:peptide ABC transporter substrate-binding protein [uncultured Pleomorphomonas sp.]SCM73828.1 ABC-type transporter, periplasmic subunit [uncultured Pleomorphomonas sp.]
MNTPRVFRTLSATLIAGSMLAVLATPSLAEVVIRRGNGGEPQTLDQAHISIDVEGFIVRDMFEGLTIYDPHGKVIPGVAESWTLSDDGTVYTFKLREGANWSDGKPVTADDFVFAYRRMEDPKEAAEYATILYPIKNAEAINGGKAAVDTLGVKAVDAKTLEITLERPTPYFIELLAHYAALPAPSWAIEKFGGEWVKPGNIVCNGAFCMTENVPNDHITAVKNPKYWDATNVKIDKIIYNPSEDQATTERMFEAGELDLVYNFQTDQMKFLEDKLGKDQVLAFSDLASYYYVFDSRTPPFDDARVRQALSMAVDREFLSEKIFSNTQMPAYSFVPPGIPGYESATVSWADLDQLDREDKAKELLKEAGYGEGGKPLKIDIRFNTNDNHKKVATAIADMWKALGAEVTIQNLDVKSHYAYLQEGGAFNVARAGWTADYSDPENFLNLLVSTNTSFNYGHWKNEKFDELMKASYEERDAAKRMQLLHDAERIAMDEQGLAPLMVHASTWLVSNKVQGFAPNPANEHLTKFLSFK